MKPKYVMVLDTTKCVGCSACVIGCKQENKVPDGKYRDWVTSETRGRFPNLKMENRSERCNHCEHAPCVDNCPTGASHRSGDNTVQVDRRKCSGCKNCIVACPYGSRYVHDEGFVDKCTFCHHIDKATSCARICPTGCIAFGDANDPESEVAKLMGHGKIKVLKPEYGTWPQVYYLNKRA